MLLEPAILVNMTTNTALAWSCSSVQDELGREVPYVHCFNHQNPMGIVHTMLGKRVVKDLLSIHNAFYKFMRKPIVAAQCDRGTLKRLLNQRPDRTPGHSENPPSNFMPSWWIRYCPPWSPLNRLLRSEEMDLQTAVHYWLRMCWCPAHQ